MRITMKSSLALALVLAAATAWAQPPRIANAKMEQRMAVAGLEREFRSLVAAASEPAWVGYAVPIVPGDRTMCCGYVGRGWDQGCGCRLEGTQAGGTATQAPIKLEGPSEMLVLFRAEKAKVGKIRTFTPDCALDAGGLRFTWLSDVKAAESVALLQSLVQGDAAGTGRGDTPGRSALAALALHRDAAADRSLEQLAAASQPLWLRKEAALWLGSARGRSGYDVLARIVPGDQSAEFRKQAVFALSVSPVPDAVDAMIRLARTDPSADVRGQSLFWLANKAGAKVIGTIAEALENDPETQVKERAVFALSQMPKDEGVPKLIEVAKNNKNPVVRRRAMFWLGQSKDPRALAFFEQILSR
jgi:hypothetical protein